MILQLPLSLIWPDQATFDNFYPAGNEAVVACLRQMMQPEGQRCIYLYGSRGVGLSHLLYAACQQLQQSTGTAAYLSLKNPSLAPQMLEGMENFGLICWDDIGAIAGNLFWEEALFHCYNRAQLSGSHLLIGGDAPPAQIAWALADLGSRLAASTVFAIQPLADKQKIQALQHRAQRRGLHLSEEVGHYLLQRCPRDMQALFATLDKLDHFSLAAQRRLTIPFVKQVLGV